MRYTTERHCCSYYKHKSKLFDNSCILNFPKNIFVLNSICHLDNTLTCRHTSHGIQQWRIKGGRARRAPLLRPKIFSISCSFSQNLAKSYVGAPLEGWRPLLRGILDPPLYRVRFYQNWVPNMESPNRLPFL